MPIAKDYEVRDASDRMISGVLAYDTETQEAEMFLRDDFGVILQDKTAHAYVPIRVKVQLPGSYLYNVKTQEPV